MAGPLPVPGRVAVRPARVAATRNCAHPRRCACSTGCMSRRPEHWEDEAPNEPEPQSFLREHPPVVWWIMAGLGVLVVIGLTAAWLTQRESDEPNTTEDPAVAGAREESH